MMVYGRCMSCTNVNIDDEACAEVTHRYRLATRHEAVNFALRALRRNLSALMKLGVFAGRGGKADLGESRKNRAT